MNYVELQKQNTEVSYEDFNNMAFEKLAQADSDAEREAIRNVIVMKNSGLAKMTAGRIFDTQEYTNLWHEDILQLAQCILIKAVDRFDSSKGAKFSTYACYLMNWEVRKWIARKENKHAFNLRLDSLIMDNGDIAYNDCLLNVDEDEALKEVYHNDERRLVDDFMSGLSDIEKTVVTLYYGLDNNEPMRQQEIGKVVDVIPSSVSRILRRSIVKMRSMATARGIENVL